MPTEWNGTGNRAARRVYCRDAGIAAIESEDPMRRRVVDDGIGILPDFHRAGDLQRLQIEDADASVPAIAGKAFAGIWRNGNSVYAVSVGNIADTGAGVGVQHHHMS